MEGTNHEIGMEMLAFINGNFVQISLYMGYDFPVNFRGFDAISLDFVMVSGKAEIQDLVCVLIKNPYHVE